MKIAQTMLKEKEIDLKTPTQQPTQPQQPQQQQAPLQLQGVPTNGSN